jgi:hypothetical protein
MTSKLSIEFLQDFDIGYELLIYTSLSGAPSTTLGFWEWVATRVGAFEVTTGTPTGIVGERTAINFKAAFDLDNPTGYATTVTDNVIEIESETEGEDYVGFKASDNGTRLVDGVDFILTFDNYTEPIDISNVEFALTRSPHYINTPFFFDTTTKATFKLYIWSGDLSSVPSLPTYTITKVRPTVDYEQFNTDISKIVGELLDGKPTIDLTLTTQIVDTTNNELKWLKYVVSFTDSEETVADIEGTLIASEGFGYFEEGINPTKPSNDILTSCDYRKVSRDGFILLPFANVGNITSIDIQSENLEIDETETITDSNNSNKAVQYLEVDVSQATTDEFITVTFQPDGDIITYEIVDECRYEPKQIIFKNKYGFYEGITFFKKSTNSIEITNDDFVNAYVSNGTYSTTDHQKQKINIQGIESLTLNSGYIKETENSIYREMMLSDKVYLYGNNGLTPLNIKSSSLEFKNRVNDKLVKYTIEFEYAYNLIQNI